MSPRSLIAIGATVVVATAVSPSIAATPTPLASCSLVRQNGKPTITPWQSGAWRVQTCVFDRVAHGRVVLQVGTTSVSPSLQPAARTMPCEPERLGSWPGIREAQR